MLPKEYRTISDIAGPLMLVEQVTGIKYGELVEIELADGSTRRGARCWRCPVIQHWCRCRRYFRRQLGNRQD